eukprot:SM000100S09387  [mRNA]  locus=s100:48907:51292:- [translate_table: standard]
MIPPPTAGGSSRRTAQLFNSLVQNPYDEEVEILALGRRYLLPARSAFLMSDVTRMQPLLPASRKEGFNLILVDPPWENKSVQRHTSYPTLPNRHLLALPIQKLAHSKGALVALWITNREKLRKFTEEELLPAWGAIPAATWIWLKVFRSGEMISPLNSSHHKPYEVLLLSYIPDEAASKADPRLPDVRDLPEDNLVVISELAQHSRKPPLGRILCSIGGPGLLERCVPGDGRLRGVELFAREVQAGWTAWGNEPLRFQDAHYFEPLAKPVKGLLQQAASLSESRLRCRTSCGAAVS